MNTSDSTGTIKFKRVTVYASSSNALAQEYYHAAATLGSILAQAGMEIVYGGGGVGLMRALADAALADGAHVHGVIPGFLNTVEHGHKALSRLDVVENMRERKHQMLAGSNAVVALPGGTGTLEEVLEVLTLKRLGQFTGPIILLNTSSYYSGLVDFLEKSIVQGFMSPVHLKMWSLVDHPEQVLDAFENSHAWGEDAARFASVRSQA